MRHLYESAVPIPARDGVLLAANVWRPAEGTEVARGNVIAIPCAGTNHRVRTGRHHAVVRYLMGAKP